MLHPENLSLSLLIAYAETHFRFFPFLPSALFKREPEIVFDVPRWLNPEKDLPVILTLNDMHIFPLTLTEASITVSRKGQKPLLFNFKNIQDFELSHSFQDQLRVFIFIIPRTEIPEGDILVNATVSIKKGRSTKVILNDNLFSSSKRPFTCRVSPNPLPGNELCIYGDMHNHTMYSQSHVEYGPPLEIFDLIADTSGLSFLAITDHSYDLACQKDNYLIQDQSLRKWDSFDGEFKQKYKTIMIQGEEISCLNSKGKVVHLCGIGINKYIPGNLDGGRKNKFFQQLTISQAVEAVHAQGGIAFAAHPGSLAGMFQSLFLHRGIWSEEDAGEYLDGMQALNSGYNGSWERGKSLWIKMLQNGFRVPILAGNDAHGDFNRYRAIGVPFFNIYEDFQRFMGYGKTGIYGDKKSSRDILKGIKNGTTFVTTGPYVSINYNSSPGSTAISVRDINSSINELNIYALSSAEFGSITKVTLLSGHTGSSHERTIFIKQYSQKSYDIRENFLLSSIQKPCYLRAEIESKREAEIFKGFTSACWLGV